MKYLYSEYVTLFRALSDETRLKIINMLSSGEMCACHILDRFSITQSTLSYHMKILTESNLVKGVRDGAWMRYTLNTEKMGELSGFLKEITKEKEQCVCACDTDSVQEC